MNSLSCVSKPSAFSVTRILQHVVTSPSSLVLYLRVFQKSNSMTVSEWRIVQAAKMTISGLNSMDVRGIRFPDTYVSPFEVRPLNEMN